MFRRSMDKAWELSSIEFILLIYIWNQIVFIMLSITLTLSHLQLLFPQINNWQTNCSYIYLQTMQILFGLWQFIVAATMTYSIISNAQIASQLSNIIMTIIFWSWVLIQTLHLILNYYYPAHGEHRSYNIPVLKTLWHI
jgi:hypothetical protein